VILIELEQVVGGEPPDAAPGGRGANVRLVDRMAVVVVDGSGSLP
jgi:hypothetical protein